MARGFCIESVLLVLWSRACIPPSHDDTRSHKPFSRLRAVEQTFAELRSRLAEIVDLRRSGGLLSWDQHVMMPPGGAKARAEQLATLGKISHELFVSDEIGRLLEKLRSYEEQAPPESDEAALIRVTRRDWEKARRVPSELRAEITRQAALAFEAWAEARRISDFSHFLPYLEKNVELKHRYIECFEPRDELYDVLLDDYEEGMTTAEARAVLDDVRQELVPLIREVAEQNDRVDDSCLYGDFPIERQKDFERIVLERFGYDPASWRLDPTAHPFASVSCPTDIRITTRYFEDRFESLFSTMHEFGHGLYEHQIDASLDRTPLQRGASMALHESQSRMWENLVGRSLPFWRRFYPQLQELFPVPLGAVDVETFYRAVNKVQPSFIRVEADEATYNLHIILRFELEQEIFGGDLSLTDLPEAWNARMRDYLGIDVAEDAQGVLQDVHWSFGGFGYFATYSLGNVVSCQIWEKVREALPDLDDQIEQGEFGELRDWLRENLHRHGRKFTPRETLERVAGGPMDAGPYIRYLKNKLGGIYELEAAAMTL
jgi:carboxypeptidase Taq